MTRADVARLARRVGIGPAVLVVGLLVVALLVARLSWHMPLSLDAERALYDTRAVLGATRVDQDDRIALIAYTDETLRKTGKRSPVDRALLGRALTRIDALGARAIGIDVLIDQPQPEDPLLKHALSTMKTPTFIAFTTAEATPDLMLPWQEAFERAFLASVPPATRPASARLEADSDNVMRAWPTLMPKLPLPLADSVAQAGKRAVPVAPSVRAGEQGTSVVYRLPTSSERPVFASFPIDLFDSDAAPLLRAQIAGRYVIVGGDISDVDRFDTPLTRVTRKTTSGLEVQATMLAQRLDGRYPPAISSLLKWLLALVVVLSAMWAGAADLGGVKLVAMIGMPLLAIVLLPFGLQRAGIDTLGLPAFGWLFGWIIAYIATAAAARRLGSQQRRFAQGALGRYLPRDVAAAILRDPDQLSLHGERRTIFALFTDMEGFTKLTHALPPETTAMLLNRYLDMLSEQVLAHGGTLDKFVGDAVVAFWGAPIARADDGDRALAAAIAMADAGEVFRRTAPEGLPPIGRTRVGLHRGEAVVGNFGGEGRIQYTALGDAMNAAARLEGANKTLGTRALVSAEAAEGMNDPPLRPMGRVRVRGRAKPIDVFEPAPETTHADRAELAAILARFDAGDANACADLRDYATARPDDNALMRLHAHIVTIDPGGFLALD